MVARDKYTEVEFELNNRGWYCTGPGNGTSWIASDRKSIKGRKNLSARPALRGVETMNQKMSKSLAGQHRCCFCFPIFLTTNICQAFNIKPPSLDANTWLAIKQAVSKAVSKFETLFHVRRQVLLKVAPAVHQCPINKASLVIANFSLFSHSLRFGPIQSWVSISR